MNQEPKAMDERLQAIRERVGKATKGPWMLLAYDDDLGGGVKVIQSAEGAAKNPKWQHFQICDDVCQEPDADFIAHSRADIEFLLAKLDQAGKLIFELQDKMSVALYVINGLENLDLQKRITANQLIQFFRENEHLLRTPTPPEAKCEKGKKLGGLGRCPDCDDDLLPHCNTCGELKELGG